MTRLLLLLLLTPVSHLAAQNADTAYNKAVKFYFAKQYDSSFTYCHQARTMVKGNERHAICEILSTIHFERGAYDSSLHYITLADKKYPYQHFCGNEKESRQLFIAMRYAAIYDHYGDAAQVLKVLLPVACFDLVNNGDAVRKIASLLKGKEGTKAALDDAIAHMYVKKKVHYIRFMDTVIPVDMEEGIVDSHFYKALADGME